MAGADRKLTKEAQRFIVQRHAWRDSPQSIADQVKEEFGIVVTRQTIEAYDPVKCERRGKSIKAEWVELYKATRAAIEDGVVEIGMADKNVRLSRWETLYQRALKNNNLGQAADFLERAAKEANDFWAKQRAGGLGAFFDNDGDGDGDEHRGGFELHIVKAKDGQPVN